MNQATLNYRFMTGFKVVLSMMAAGGLHFVTHTEIMLHHPVLCYAFIMKLLDQISFLFESSHFTCIGRFLYCMLSGVNINIAVFVLMPIYARKFISCMEQ